MHELLHRSDYGESMTPSNATRLFLRALCHTALAITAAVVLGGCHHLVPKAFRAKDCNKPQPYDLAQSIAPLQVPPGVDPPDTQGALRVPADNEPAPPPRRLTDPCLDEPPSFAGPATPATPAPAAVPRARSVPSD